MNEIEQYYEKFRAELACPFEYHNIDYIGVCLDADASVPCRFKMYWKRPLLAPFDHWLTRWLKEHRMLQYMKPSNTAAEQGNTSQICASAAGQIQICSTFFLLWQIMSPLFHRTKT